MHNGLNVQEDIPLYRSLSFRLLAFTLVAVLFVEVVIFLPSVARFRQDWMRDALSKSHLAILPITSQDVDPFLSSQLQHHAGVLHIASGGPEAPTMLTSRLGRVEPVDAVYDVDETNWWTLIRESLETMNQQERVIRLIGRSPMDPNVLLDVIIREFPLRRAMLDYGLRILGLSLLISALISVAIFVVLKWLYVAPITRLTRAIRRFRATDDGEVTVTNQKSRRDEIGFIEQAIRHSQQRSLKTYRQQQRFAVIGEAVSGLHHDLRNMLAGTMLVSERLEMNPDPDVRNAAGRLLDNLDRATRLCQSTLIYATADQNLKQTTFDAETFFQDLVDLTLVDEHSTIDIQLPERMQINGDRDQLFRIFLNLIKNAQRALPDKDGKITIEGLQEDDVYRFTVTDNGSGIDEGIAESLFQPYSTGSAGGTGLGLSVSRDIARAHGGDLVLDRTDSSGTSFVLTLENAS